MRTYLVKYKSSESSSVIDDRIKNTGKYYALSTSEFLVYSCYDNAKDLYEEIVKDDFKTLTILVIAIDPNVSVGYWGIAKKELWQWLRECNQD